MEPKISVCMAVRNGESYLREQLNSILPQLAGDDEIIISDDHSKDKSIPLIQDMADHRIKIFSNPGHGLISNFENSLRHATGTYIFLADQDDVWMPEKVRVTLPYLHQDTLVVSDCRIVDHQLTARYESFYRINQSGKGIVKNLFKNSYMGCCMAFHRRLLEKALPFPAGIPMHDLWIGLIAELFFSVKFIDESLVLHRRHASNASTTGKQSTNSFTKRASDRWILLKTLIKLRYAY